MGIRYGKDGNEDECDAPPDDISGGHGGCQNPTFPLCIDYMDQSQTGGAMPLYWGREEV